MHSTTANRTLIALAAMLNPVFAGAIIYYSLRRTHTDLAHFGNAISFAAFFLWPVAIVTHIIHFRGNAIPIGLAVLGIVLAIVAVLAIRRTRAGLAADNAFRA